MIPLCPEPIVKQDGQTKNDCERNACKRLVPKSRQDHPKLRLVALEDGLASNAPHIRDLQAEGFRFLLGAKPGDHKWLYAEAARRRAAGQCLVVSRVDPKTNHRQTAVLVRDVPLNESNSDLLVHLLEYTETDSASNEIVKRSGWVTDLDVNEDNIWEVVRGGRTRWKIENETFNTLKNQGYHFEHNFGHGHKHLSVVFATLMMLAFLVDQVQQLCCPLFRAAWKELGSKRSLWEKVRGRFDNFVLDSMRQLLESIAYGLDRTAPPIAYPAGAPRAPPIDDSS